MSERVKVEFSKACPDCGSTQFHPGPRGGHSHNIKCAHCGAKFWYSPPFTPERIDNDDKFYQQDARLTLAQIVEEPHTGLSTLKDLL